MHIAKSILTGVFFLACGTTTGFAQERVEDTVNAVIQPLMKQQDIAGMAVHAIENPAKLYGRAIDVVSDLVGATFLPSDGQASPSDITLSLAKGARMHGARIHEGVRVLGFAMDGGLEGSLVEGEEIQRSPERLFVAGAKDPLVLRPHTAERYLVEQIRDEAHRFAITGHRGRRQKARNTSRLEDIPGIGPRRRGNLLRHFGGLAGLKAAGVEEISRVDGVNDALAERIYATLHGLDAVEDGSRQDATRSDR